MNPETELELQQQQQQQQDESLPDCCNRNGCLVRELRKLVLWCDWPKSVLALALLHVFINYAAKTSLICAVMLLTMMALTSSIIYDLYLLYKQFNEGDPVQPQPYMTLFLCPAWSNTLIQSLNMCLAKIPLIAGLQNPFLAFTLMNALMYIYFVGNLVSGSTLATCALYLLFSVPPVYVCMHRKDNRMETRMIVKQFIVRLNAAGDLAQKKLEQHKMENQNIGEAHNDALEPQGRESSTETNPNQEATFEFSDTLDSIELIDTEETILLNDTEDSLVPNETFELNDTPETILLNDTQKPLVLNDTVGLSFGLNYTQESIEPKNSQDAAGLNMTEEVFVSSEQSFEPRNTQVMFAETAQKDV
ncbi:uncharacterized protein LOC117580369 [Drosophila guanche]|uniref:Reticulon domain-containing protein n=1 Tax=Drosophila guanche TaxID=7266 RepID=A0A3B0JWD9_DROGU|nr:uncharacterized protein LOC117580369 [Drosophila guanche]SPP77031.1 Hypothetical predicted protein [Drosophila guanche]